MYVMPKNPAVRRSLIITGAIVLAYLLLLATLVYLRSARETESKDFTAAQEKYYDALRSDTIGGATPQETMRLFIAALKTGDPEKAAQYFTLDDQGGRERWRVSMHDSYAAGLFADLASALERAEPQPDGIIGNEFYALRVPRDDGSSLLDVSLSFNGRVWKISSM